MLNLDLSKYSKDSSFADPIVRCDRCQKLLTKKSVQSTGMCKHCGSRRIRNVIMMTSEELEVIKSEDTNIDPDFLALFEEVQLAG